MKNKLKIAVYSGDIPSTTFIERLIKGLSGSQHQIFIFGFIKRHVSYNASVSVFGYKNIKIYKALHLLKYSTLLFLFKNSDKSKLDKILKNNSKNSLQDKLKNYPVLWHKPDIFHIQWAKGLSDWIWVQEFGIKLVLSLRGAHINYSPIADENLASMYRENFPKVNAFHAVSKAIGLEAEKYKAQKEKTRVIHSGLDLNPNVSLEKRENKTFNIISVGRPHWIKGYSYALDSCKILKEENFTFKYTIIGGADDIETLYQIHDLQLENEVVLLGKLPFDQVQERMQSADLLLLPSVKEGLANVVLEAMALKTLVLTTDCGGMNEVVIDGQNGFLVPIRDSRKMSNKILEIANLTDKNRMRIAQNAFQTILNNHSDKKMIDDMLELYQSI